MRHRRCFAWLLAALCVAASLAAPPSPAAAPSPPAPPTRIVSLLPSLTESVCALGGCAKLVGTDRFSNSPASVLALPKLGGLDDAQVERIVLPKPDLVLATPGARVIARLEALGAPVLTLDSRNLAEVQHSLGVLARVLSRA